MGQAGSGRSREGRSKRKRKKGDRSLNLEQFSDLSPFFSTRCTPTSLSENASAIRQSVLLIMVRWSRYDGRRISGLQEWLLTPSGYLIRNHHLCHPFR